MGFIKKPNTFYGKFMIKHERIRAKCSLLENELIIRFIICQILSKKEKRSKCTLEERVREVVYLTGRFNRSSSQWAWYVIEY